MLPLTRFDYRAEVLASIRVLAQLARKEDLPDRDLTADLLGYDQQPTRARIFTRQPIVMSGQLWIQDLIDGFFGPDETPAQVKVLVPDGAVAQPGTDLIHLAGPARAILALERTLLNFLGRAIGIATATHAYVEKVRESGCPTHILDTRKTLPGFRWLDKYAVVCGGGFNHRMNLSDQILLKENHIAELGGMAKALESAFAQAKGKPFIVEVRTFEELALCLQRNCPIIMLDNFTPEQVKRACEMPRQSSLIEVSGGIHLNNIATYLNPKLDRISIGALTHSVQAPDLSLLVEDA
ncbi:MAG: carboxylating nicotinate-nucleotide diphosphorylase [Acidobacteria bacterium]|nr:carboxylating nicotinate-nucleotide diphosphorylase [Acidobacteriota bacterium]MCB9399672.1 carboxylating nicotinate-nucleotide diphosphorylase [Acidobacteriota bacterium]